MIDWSLGEYEHTAAELEPVAAHVVSLAEPHRGQRVLDLATGTGNAALLAARTGAAVTGIDVAPRLVDVACRRAAEAGLEASFLAGDVEALPFDDDAFDVALSVFGVIFADDARRAFAEFVRVLAPGGRGFITVWVPAGPIDAMVSVFARAVAQATGSTPKRFPWHEPSAVRELAASHDAEIRFHDGELRITAPSPEAYLAATEQAHPMSVASRPLLERTDSSEAVREQALAALRDGNEDPNAFLVTSPYRVVEIRR
jgi:SAM-dependent methyltransferase